MTEDEGVGRPTYRRFRVMADNPEIATIGFLLQAMDDVSDPDTLARIARYAARWAKSREALLREQRGEAMP